MLRKSTVDFVELMRGMGRDASVFVGLAEAHQLVAILFDISQGRRRLENEVFVTKKRTTVKTDHMFMVG